MAQRWLIAKYVRDLRRREPRNVGIILFSGDRVLARFLAEDPAEAEKIDGRAIRHQFGSPTNYRAWVHYWRSAAGSTPEAALLARAQTDNYYLERGGQLMAGPEFRAEELLDKLYSELIVDMPIDVEEAPTALAGPLDEFLSEPGEDVDIQRNVVLELDENDQASFEYVLTAKRRVAIKVVTLNGQPRKTWEAVHAAAYAVQIASEVQAPDRADPYAVIVESDPGPQKDRQVRVLESRLGSQRVRRATAEDMLWLRQRACALTA